MNLRPSWITKIVTTVTIAVATVGIAPCIAEGQARGSLQVSATIVSAETALGTLEAARAAAATATNPNTTRRQHAAPTVARVSVARSPNKLVVTIDYSRS